MMPVQFNVKIFGNKWHHCTLYQQYNIYILCLSKWHKEFCCYNKCHRKEGWHYNWLIYFVQLTIIFRRELFLHQQDRVTRGTHQLVINQTLLIFCLFCCLGDLGEYPGTSCHMSREGRKIWSVRRCLQTHHSNIWECQRVWGESQKCFWFVILWFQVFSMCLTLLRLDTQFEDKWHCPGRWLL